MEGKVRIEAKADLKARLGRSPDKANAVVMAVAGKVARKRRPRAGVATACYTLPRPLGVILP